MLNNFKAHDFWVRWAMAGRNGSGRRQAAGVFCNRRAGKGGGKGRFPAQSLPAPAEIGKVYRPAVHYFGSWFVFAQSGALIVATNAGVSLSCAPFMHTRARRRPRPCPSTRARARVRPCLTPFFL